MGQLTRARLKLAGLLAVAVALILWPVWFQREDGSIQPPEQRKAMPRFSYPTLAGESWSLEDRKGRIVLVNFWATWCGPCREETPDLVRVHARYRERGFEIAGISMDEDPAKVAPAFLKQYRVTYPVLVPPVQDTLANAIQSLPTSFLVDRSGKVARTWVGAVREKTLSTALDQLLAEQTN
jgi:cytochrome c biogenesis protein CcmG/thiol:disulfide interchange protein DsbE